MCAEGWLCRLPFLCAACLCNPACPPAALVAGVVGIALALAGADVVLADLPHVTPLTRMNVEVRQASLPKHVLLAGFSLLMTSAAPPMAHTPSQNLPRSLAAHRAGQL